MTRKRKGSQGDDEGMRGEPGENEFTGGAAPEQSAACEPMIIEPGDYEAFVSIVVTCPLSYQPRVIERLRAALADVPSTDVVSDD